MNVVAHQGGWDEILIPVAIVLLVFAYGTRNRNAGDQADAGPCAYCAHPLEAGDARCPECGFRKLVAAA
jgi:hypothetical protein